MASETATNPTEKFLRGDNEWHEVTAQASTPVPYAVYGFTQGLAIAGENAAPSALSFDSAPIRAHNATGIITRQNAQRLRLQPATYVISTHIVVDADSTQVNAARSNYHLQLHNGTTVLDEKRDIGYIRSAPELGNESFDTHHVITVSEVTDLEIRVGVDNAGADFSSATTSPNGNVIILVAGNDTDLTVGAGQSTFVDEALLPSASLGKDGDTYVSETSAIVYKKESGAWVQKVDLVTFQELRHFRYPTPSRTRGDGRPPRPGVNNRVNRHIPY